MSNLIERYPPWDPVFGDDLNHIIDILDGMRYNLINVATGPSNARYVIDTTSIRAYDNTSTNYGAPSGAGVTFEVSPNGSIFIGGGNLKLKSAGTAFIEFNSSTVVMRVNDGTRDRWAAGNLGSYTDPRGVVSPAGYSARLVDANGNLINDATQALMFFPVYTGYTPVDTTNFATARFQVTSDVQKLVKVTVSFYCDTFKVGQQSTATGTSTTSAGGSSHAHSVPSVTVSGTTTGGDNNNHSHGFSLSNIGGGATVFYDGISGTVGIAGGATPITPVGNENTTHSHSLSGQTTSSTTSGADTTHTHGVTVPSLSLTAPANLYSTGGAAGVHVKIYNQAGTLIADLGPYAGGAGTFVSDIDITSYITGTGWWQVQFTSTALGGIEGQVNIKAIVSAA